MWSVSSFIDVLCSVSLQTFMQKADVMRSALSFPGVYYENVSIAHLQMYHMIHCGARENVIIFLFKRDWCFGNINGNKRGYKKNER